MVHKFREKKKKKNESNLIKQFLKKGQGLS